MRGTFFFFFAYIHVTNFCIFEAHGDPLQAVISASPPQGKLQPVIHLLPPQNFPVQLYELQGRNAADLAVGVNFPPGYREDLLEGSLAQRLLNAQSLLNLQVQETVKVN